ncbi:LPS-assembly protein LptD [Geotalea toluenoxydans]|uniref:LPS-assembly protein LptD n=1 Tax=Geotalea toluenoxydans TaxID=421624 RepID=UPI0006D2B116|nr:LPS assembly protein LptD [Geotalea toluenoxydans]
MKLSRALGPFCKILFFLACASSAMATDVSPSGPVRISADSLSYAERSSSFQADGNVRIRYDGVTLLSDSAVFSEEEGEAIAEGNVVLEKGEDILHGDRVRLNTVTEQGEVANGYLFLKKPNFHIRSGLMSKVGTADYHMERGAFTTCDGDSPSWHFTARNLDLTLEEYATGRDVLFYVKDVPLFYLPYFIFPVKTERQSGFLFPRLGNSTKKGFYLDIPFYWAITPSQDATLNLDIQTKRGVGTGIDYRYMAKGGSEGSVAGYGIYDTSQSRFRGDIVQRHVDATADSLTFRSDINLVSDRDFYRDFTNDAGEYNRQYLDSRAALTKHWQDQVLNAELGYVQNVDMGSSDKTTLQRLPSVSFTAVRRKIGDSPFFFSLDSSAVNFYRPQGIEGQRFTVHPTFTSYFKAGFLDLSASAGYSQRLYNAYGGDSGNGTHGEGVADAGLTISSRFARVFDTGMLSIPKVRHLLIPEVAYSFVQERNQDELPFFDYEDRMLGQNLVNLSLANYVTGKFTQADGSSLYREIMFLRLSQGYQATGSRRDLLTLVDEGRPLTDLRIESRLSPISGLSLDLDSRFNTYRGSFSSTILAAGYDGEDGNRFGVGYRFSRESLEYLEGTLGVGLVKPFVFNYTGRYSFDKGDFLESIYALEYKHQCWGVTLSYRDRADNREFMLTFTLAGVGAVGPLKTF